MKKIYFGLFLGLMVLGGISIFATGQKEFSSNENRYLKTVSDIKSTDDIEGTLADQFPLRDGWLTVASGTRFLTGAREINDTYIGKDGYLFDKCSENDFSMLQYKNNLAYLGKFVGGYEVDNISLVLVPSPYTILPEKLPANAQVYDADKKYRAAETAMGGSAKVVDLRNTLKTLSRATQVYYKTDHHWTTRAAYAGYLAAVCDYDDQKAVDEATDFEGLTAVSEEFHGTLYSRVLLRDKVYDTIDALDLEKAGLSEISEKLYDSSKLETKDKYAYFLGGNTGRMDIKGTGTGNLLLIKDSFANCMVPFLAQKYANITIVDLRYLSEEIAHLMENGVDGESYNDVIVLYEMSNFADDVNIYKLARGL